MSLLTVVGNSLMSLSLALGEVSLIILAWLYDSLVMLEGMVLTMHSFMESSLTMRMIFRVIVRGSFKLGA